MAGLRKRAKDFQRCLRNIGSFSDGQARVKKWECDDLSSLVVEVTPSDGPYKGASVSFEIFLSDDFPVCAPDVMCRTNIYHPNIDHTSDEYNVCLNLFDEWQETFGLEDCIQGLLFLLHNPNLDDPLSPYFSPEMDGEEFLENVEKTLKGEEVEGVSFAGESEAECDSAADETENEVDLILEKVEILMTSLDESEDEEEVSCKEGRAEGLKIEECAKTGEARSDENTLPGLRQEGAAAHPVGHLSGGLDPYLDGGILLFDFLYNRYFRVQLKPAS